MSHLAFHLVAGWLLGTLLALPRLAREVLAGRPIAGPMGAWLLLSWGVALYAAVPSVLARLGVAGTAGEAPWMNLFLCHALIRRLRLGGDILGAASLGLCFAAQYGLLVLAAWRAAGPRPSPASCR
jgi:hypothetical protein